MLSDAHRNGHCRAGRQVPCKREADCSSAIGWCAQVQSAMQGLYARAAWVPPKLSADERQQQRQQRKRDARWGSVGAA